jgi:hypothetical protein
MLFLTSFSAAHVKIWPRRRKIRHASDMAEGKFDMHAGSGTLVARTLLLVNLQPAQTGSAMSSCCQKRRAEAKRWHSARQNLRNGRSKRTLFDRTWFFAKFDMFSTSKIPKPILTVIILPSLLQERFSVILACIRHTVAAIGRGRIR